MKQYVLPFMIFISALISGCSTMNSDFSCKVTAGDSCLTIEQVDAMTRFADGNGNQNIQRKSTHKIQSKTKKSHSYLSENDSNSRVWLAPWKDRQGKQHEAVTLAASQL